VLVAAIAPAVGEALAREEIHGWFFLRYRDEAGRDHLRVRVRRDDAAADGGVRRFARFAARLERHLGPARAAGDVALVEEAEYLPERARFGGARAMRFVEEVFSADSALCLALLALDPALRPDGTLLLARSFDSLAAGLGLDAVARLALAAGCRRRSPFSDAGDDPLAPLYRERQAELLAALDGDRAARLPRAADAASRALAAHRHRLRAIAARARRARIPLAPLLPSLLHLATVRLVGPSPEREAIGYYLWQRASESLAARSRR
jgi:thiopeptide-type bacteriocin biosynthesis protein